MSAKKPPSREHNTVLVQGVLERGKPAPGEPKTVALKKSKPYVDWEDEEHKVTLFTALKLWCDKSSITPYYRK